MCGLVQTSDLAEPAALGFQALLDFFIIVNLHKISRHYLPPAYAVFEFDGERMRTNERLRVVVAEVIVAEVGDAEVGEAEQTCGPVPALG
jgi:hypothetical protein